MKASEIKKIVENRFQELGASKILLSPSDYCWEFQGEFYKMTALSDFWIIEWTNNPFYALNQCFEDVRSHAIRFIRATNN